MPEWTSDELNKIGTAEELEIASLGQDGTLRKPTTIWVVRVGDDLYVRSAYGRTIRSFSVAIRDIFLRRTVASLQVKAAKVGVLNQFCKLCKSENQ